MGTSLAATDKGVEVQFEEIRTHGIILQEPETA